MSVKPVNGSAPPQQASQTSSSQPPKQQSAIPQDTVNISSAARARQSSSGDVDHDGDSK